MEPESKISAILSPFATASLVLLLVLSVMEYVRPGFVSLFLDFRAVAAVALGLWVLAALVGGSRRRGVGTIALVLTTVVASAPILYRFISAYGRLGLVVFVSGIITFIIIFISVWTASSARS